MITTKHRLNISMHIKTHLKQWGLLKLLVLVLFFNVPISANAASLTGSASVRILQPVVLAQSVAMTFGDINVQGADTITLDPSGSISAQNSANIVAGSALPGRFNVSGSPNAAVTISFAEGILNGSGAPMAVNNITHDSGATPTFAGDGALSFSVGADLVINDGQEPGVYTGTYEVSVNYQ